MRLSRAIAEFETNAIRHVWQRPELYELVSTGEVCVVYGRKGAGKSTLLEYIKLEAPKRILLLQGRDKDFLGRILASIPAGPLDASNRQILVRNIELLLECLVCVSVVNTFLSPAPESLIGEFVTENGLNGPDAGKRVASLLAPLFAKLSLPSIEFEDALNKILKKYSFDDFRSAVYHMMRENSENKSKSIVCIDDIDEINFSFSSVDRCFIEALFAFVMNMNVSLKRDGILLTILITCPTEIFSHSGLFGTDWVEAQAKCLAWRTAEPLLQLVNRRIAVEYAVRERKSLDGIDRFSSSTEQTWHRLFPKEIWNPVGMKEQTFDFLVRHTNYTPRQILMLCEKASERIAEKNLNPRSTDAGDEMEMAGIFEDCVSDNCNRVLNQVFNIYEKLYDGLQEVFDAFRSRPNIWTRNSLIKFVDVSGLALVRSDVKSKTAYSGIHLVGVLQKIGILGLGPYQKTISPTGNEAGMGRHFKPRFSFIEDTPPDIRWEVAVFAPYFVSAVDMEVVDKLTIKPHESFFLKTATARLLDAYQAK